jgi:hypothetical protein
MCLQWHRLFMTKSLTNLIAIEDGFFQLILCVTPQSDSLAQVFDQDKTCNILCHERLAIVDPESGVQPILNADGSLALCVNGEIYNHLQLKAKYFPNTTFKTKGDCEVSSCSIFNLPNLSIDRPHTLDGRF